MKSLLQLSINRAGLNTHRLHDELTGITSQLKQRKNEIIALTRKMASSNLSKEIYEETVNEITREQETLKTRATELEMLLKAENTSTQYMQSFQTELRKFVKLMYLMKKRSGISYTT